MSVVSTVHNKCKHCYSCVRHCPVKAIRVQDGQAEVMKEQCISCGQCKKVCSQNAKQVQDDSEAVMQLLDNEQTPTVALLAPSFVAAFDSHPYQLIGAIKSLGFDRVSEVAYGAELIAEQCSQLYNGTLGEKPIITSPCPAIINLIEKHYPDLCQYLMPLVSPMIAAAKVFRELYGKSAQIVFIGPCIAKKCEISHPEVTGIVNFALTFSELEKMFTSRDINYNISEAIELDPPYASEGAVFPLSGGLLKAAGFQDDILKHELLTIDGQEEVLQLFNALSQGKQTKSLIDILFCKGCIDGPEINSDQSLYAKKQAVIDFVKHKQTTNRNNPKHTHLNLYRKYYSHEHAVSKSAEPGEHEIKEILRQSGKYEREDELNCGACGYNSCRDKSIAVYQGFAELEMCLPYLLNKAHTEAAMYKEEYHKMKLRQECTYKIIGKSDAIQNVRSFVYKAAQSTSTVLLLGESGTGKGLIAETIHTCSERGNYPFVQVNCSAIPENLLEAELFGYDSGAFTGAAKSGKKGKFEEAHGGTIFLDEIGDMSLNMQAKVLQVLQEKIVQRLGSNKPREVGVRIIAATNKNLFEEIEQGHFREDLYYRLNVLTISVPPLRERSYDIPILVKYISDKVCREHGFKPKKFSDEVIGTLQGYTWPGNVRELENIIERLQNLVDEDVIKFEHLPEHLTNRARMLSFPSDSSSLDDLVSQVEKETIAKALKKAGNNRSKAAQLLGIHRSSLYEKLKKYGFMNS